MSQAQVIQVIDTYETRGKGTEDNPVRRVRQFWSLDGKLLMEHDPWPLEQEIETLKGQLDIADRDFA